MKRDSIFWLAIILILSSCGSDDPPNPAPNPIPEPEESPYLACLPTVSENTLEVVTWNIKNFPVRSSALESVQEIIEDTDADIIAVQEIKSMSAFGDLIEALEGWSGQAIQYSSSNLRVGYLFKDAEITVIEQPSNLFPEDSPENNNAFTSFRRPVHTKIRHSNGLEVDLVNVHLKCCGGSEDRRRNASIMLKDYFDANLASDNIIFLGDFNDEIVDENDNVFQNFLDDTDNYKFTTLAIAEGPSTGWSFPSWPSQIDQIVISDELFDNELETRMLKLEVCNDDFPDDISDHRPVLIRLSGQ